MIEGSVCFCLGFVTFVGDWGSGSLGSVTIIGNIWCPNLEVEEASLPVTILNYVTSTPPHPTSSSSGFLFGRHIGWRQFYFHPLLVMTLFPFPRALEIRLWRRSCIMVTPRWWFNNCFKTDDDQKRSLGEFWWWGRSDDNQDGDGNRSSSTMTNNFPLVIIQLPWICSWFCCILSCSNYIIAFY